MGFKTFVALDALPASDVNTYLMKQAVIVCTAATRPGSPVEGMTIFETDTDKEYRYTGAAWVEMADFGAWDTWTPTLLQPGSIALTTAAGRYRIISGKLCELHWFVNPSGTGTGNNAIYISGVPASLAPRSSGLGGADADADIGRFFYLDNGTGYYNGTCGFVSSTDITLFNGGSPASALGVVPNFAVAAADSMNGSLVYELA